MRACSPPGIPNITPNDKNHTFTVTKDVSYALMSKDTYDYNIQTKANSASVTDLDAWMAHYGIPHNAKGDGKYDVTAGDHNWPIWMKLMIPCASDYLWK